VKVYNRITYGTGNSTIDKTRFYRVYSPETAYWMSQDSLLLLGAAVWKIWFGFLKQKFGKIWIFCQNPKVL
jgi:hypothetical protein